MKNEVGFPANQFHKAKETSSLILGSDAEDGERRQIYFKG